MKHIHEIDNINQLATVDTSAKGMHVIRLKGKCIRVETTTGTDTNVDQSFEHLTDVNKILEPAIKKGLLRHKKFEGEADDYPAYDYLTAQTRIAKANSMYEQLPQKVRKQYPTPADFMKAVQDPTAGFIKMLKDNGLATIVDGKDSTGALVPKPATQPVDTTPVLDKPQA